MYKGVELELHAFLSSTVDEVASFTPQPLYPAGKLSLDPLYRNLCGPQRGSDRYVEESNFLPLSRIEP
jgi:hypothetical protein